MRILIIDPQFQGEPDIERAVSGPDPVFDIVGFGPVPEQSLRLADGIMNCRSRHAIPAALVAQMDRAQVIVQAGVGFNHIDIDACARNGIAVCNTPDYGTMEVADHAIGLMLALVRAIPCYGERLLGDEAAWNTSALPAPPVRRLRGQTMGIVGLGRIGLATAMRARAFGLRVLFHDPYLPPGAELSVSLDRAATLGELLSQSDIVSLHCPMTPETTGLINDAALAQMKPGAILINTSRGGVADLDAIHRALRSGHLCAAALDVLPQEPPDRTHPLLAAWLAREPWIEGRFVLTPHAAFYTPESLADMRRLAMTAIIEWLQHGRLRACVNADLLARYGTGRPARQASNSAITAALGG